MSRVRAFLIVAVVLTTTSLAAPALALEEFFAAKLRGGNETPVAIATTGSGVFAAQLDPTETSLNFLLAYDALEGGTVTGAHIHLGRPGTTGGIVIHFCGTGGKAPCPAPPALLTGTVTAADVVTVATQGVQAGDLAEVVRAMRAGDTYVNVHTATYPGGEIRGEIQ